jgi:undecaprenyl-diphosphatase
MDILNILRAIILGIVQGLAEFVPISSSAHLVIVPWLFRWTDPALNSLVFDVALHLGTLLAVIWFFWADWVCLVRAGFAALFQWKIGVDADRKMAVMLVVGCIPGGIAGVLGESKINAAYHQPGGISFSAMLVMAVLIAALGLALYLADIWARHARALGTLSWRDAIVIGVAQAAAILPGVSRSGSTITAGLAMGLKREAAARFSFLLSAPIILGAGLKSMLDVLGGLKNGGLSSADLILFPIGFVFAAISGYVCIRFLLHYLQNHSTKIFVYYRWALAVLVLAVAFARR